LPNSLGYGIPIVVANPPKCAIVLKIWSSFLDSKHRSGSLFGSTIPVH
jgi:hypothetical protein